MTTSDSRCALFCKAGSGKTPVIIEVIKEHPSLVWYILVRSSHLPTWLEEIGKWTAWELADRPTEGATYTYHRSPATQHDFPCFIHLCKIDTLSLQRWRPDKEENYGVVIDESYYVKGYRSARYRTARAWCDPACAVLLANQDPLPESLMDLWAQMRLVIGSSHPRATEIRELYYKKDVRGFGFHELDNAVEQYRKRKDVQDHSLFYSPASEKRIHTRKILLPLSKLQQLAYRSIKNSYEVRVEDETVEYRNGLEVMMRMHQVCGGCLPYNMKLGYFQSAKVDWLLRYITANPKQKVIVWCAYRHEVDRLYSLLPGSCAHKGTVVSGNPDACVHISTEHLGVSTNKYANFPTAIYFSEAWQYFLRSQSRGRIDRHNSKHSALTYIYLLCKDTIDEEIYAKMHTRREQTRKLFTTEEIKKFLLTNP